MASKGLDSGAVGMFWGAMTLMALALLIDTEAVGWLVAPFVLVLLIVAMTRVPLRASLLTLMFFVLTLDNPAEGFASGRWKSPVHEIGGLLLNHINTRTGVKALFMSGQDILLVALLLIAISRERSGSKIDRIGRVPTPRPMVKLVFVSFAGTAFTFLSGLIRGGDTGIMLWQMDRVLYLPLVFWLFHMGLRGPADHLAVGKVVLGAAALRALEATYIIHTVYEAPDDNGIVAILPYATTHNDSMLFAMAFVVCLALAYTRAGKKYTRLALGLLPVLILGMISNHRRLVWVHVALVVLALYLVTPSNPLRRKVQRVGLMLSPLAFIYCLAGWNSGSRLFKPVQTLRSVVDSKSDNSTLWRDIENFDLISTIKQNPIFGVGYGNPYLEIVPLPAVDYPLEKYLPHNSILGLLSAAGYVGFAAMTLLWAVGAFFAMRAYYGATNAIDRAAAICAFGAVLVYLIQCWGDLGLGAPNGVWLIAPALAVAGKLAAATGGWSDKKSSSASAAIPAAGGVR
ncbi:MAG TPA: O-antigen ligase family protein [Polyangiaceae bacterium]|nr:O-antigen ligase family protein [Polyangiaceae bacterium]